LILVDLGFSGAAGGGLGDELSNFLKILPDSFASRTQAREFMAKNCPDPSIAQYLLAVSLSAEDGTLSFPFDHPALIQTIEAVRDFSVRPWVQSRAEAGMPTLVLRGMNSLVWSHEEFESERTQFKDFPSVVFKEVEGAGHGLPFEKRLEFVKLIQEFLNSHR
jgi:pimeloyl-ACP methyl ester carboxylesterase